MRKEKKCKCSEPSNGIVSTVHCEIHRGDVSASSQPTSEWEKVSNEILKEFIAFFSQYKTTQVQNIEYTIAKWWVDKFHKLHLEAKKREETTYTIGCKDEMYTTWWDCDSCGNTNIPEGSNYCGECGKKLVP